jgi:hypothetical protein
MIMGYPWEAVLEKSDPWISDGGNCCILVASISVEVVPKGVERYGWLSSN